jgi:hypothetical protein
MAAPNTALRFLLTCAASLTLAAFGALARAAPASPTHEAFVSRLGQHGPGQVIGHYEFDPGAPRLGANANTPVIGRYEIDLGGAFVLDRSTPRPLLKFDDNPEIWVLQGAPGPRGDMIYRNDLGEPMIRATRIGGMTVFTDKRPGGSAAALFGVSPPLRLPTLSPAGLFARLLQASVRASRAAQHQVEFDTSDDASPSTAAEIGDAATVASEAMVDMANRPAARRILARIANVVIAQGPMPAAALKGAELTITIDPAKGVFGRPSSRRIERAAGAW